MNEVKTKASDFIRQRRTGMIAIAAAMPVALLLWLAIAYLVPPLTGMDSLGGRIALYTEMLLSCGSVLPRDGRRGRGSREAVFARIRSAYWI